MGRSEDKQNDIISAAIKEFGEKGMIATTMESIACRANVSKRTLYKHYPCKTHLLDVVVNLLLARIAHLKEVQYCPNESLLNQLKHLAYLTIQLSSDQDYINLSRIVIIESMRCEEAAQHLNSKFKDCEQGLELWFTQASKAGVLGDYNPTLAATLFYGGIKKIAYWDQVIWWKPTIKDPEAERLITQTCELFVNAFSSK